MKSMYADKFTYKKSGSSDTFTLDAKDRTFVETVAKILYYPKEVPENCRIRSVESRSEKEKTGDKKSGYNGKKQSQGNESYDNKKSAKSDSLSYNPFAAFLEKNNK